MLIASHKATTEVIRQRKARGEAKFHRNRDATDNTKKSRPIEQAWFAPGRASLYRNQVLVG